jgi:hypothetical protein
MTNQEIFELKSKSAKGSEKVQIQGKTVQTDKEIHDFVCEVYGSTEEERKIIED